MPMCFQFGIWTTDLGALLQKGKQKLQMVVFFFLIKIHFHEQYCWLQVIGKFSFWSTFSVFFPGLICWKMSLSRNGSSRRPSHVLLQRRAEITAQRRWQERWGWAGCRKRERALLLCWQGTSRGCGSSPQTPLKVQLPQPGVWREMFAEPRANAQVANPWVPCCQDCPLLIPPGVCEGHIYPHRLQSQLASIATP